jgi:hypothetical protein
MSAFMPRRGSPVTVVERLAEYVGSTDPAFPLRLRGAPADAVLLYAKLAGFESVESLPVAYRLFLGGMGLEDGGLLEVFRIRAHLPSLIELYEEGSTELQPLSNDCPVIATDSMGEAISFDRSTKAAEPEVVETSDGEVTGRLAQSWEHLMVQAAVIRVEARRLSGGRWFSSSGLSATQALGVGDDGTGSAAAAVDILARELDLHVAWPSDFRHRVAFGERLSLFAEIGEEDQVMLYAFCGDRGLLDRIGRGARKKLGTIAEGPLRPDGP